MHVALHIMPLRCCSVAGYCCSTFNTITAVYRDEYSVARDRLLNGLSKLNETNALVDKMKLDLAALQPVLEAKAAATAELLAKVTADQEEAEKVKVVVASEEKEVKEIATKTQVRWGGGLGLDARARNLAQALYCPYCMSPKSNPECVDEIVACWGRQRLWLQVAPTAAGTPCTVLRYCHIVAHLLCL